ncbi:uncharacterized protein LOC126970287 isoform X2 [Leptidea sinapis]|uniref:uncharacterized protein LOC126970287 isoform X2 n=1 Tax=Leptidea sinapis TaxID=189913 RepID=UPI0021C4730D|nr:uncharacterized protein LOC126970287 isoform X2 [Leptidea sinapis]
MSEYFDYYQRWEPLAEFNFNLNDEDSESDDENYLYCLCSRVYLRDELKTYYVDKEYVSESDIDAAQVSQSHEFEDHSHVHFSLDTSDKVKCEKDDNASCYCSASHTENYCSTDELDPTQLQSLVTHPIQPSDSGADLTYQDYHSDYTTNDKSEKLEQEQILAEENYLTEGTWEKFWAVNGERIIWASWIKKYSDYINPAYLNENNDITSNESTISKDISAEQVSFKDEFYSNIKNAGKGRERKLSYDSKVNPYKKAHKNDSSSERNSISNNSEKQLNNNEGVNVFNRRRSCSEHERIISPWTIQGTDSMTNVTKITMSSYDATSSHVTSESSPTDDFSVTSSTSDEQFNDQTRIAKVDEKCGLDELPELDTEQYWQFLWKKHFGEVYALHYANYIEYHSTFNNQKENINVDHPANKKTEELKCLDVDCENSEGNSQELPSVIEVTAPVNQVELKVNINKSKKNKNRSNRVLNSVGALLKNLLHEETLNAECDRESLENPHKSRNVGNATAKDEIPPNFSEPGINVTETVAHNTPETQTENHSELNYEQDSILTKDCLIKHELKSQLYALKIGDCKEIDCTQEDTSSNTNEPVDAGDNDSNDTNTKHNEATDTVSASSNIANIQQGSNDSNTYNYEGDGDENPPEERAVTLKNSHEIDESVIFNERVNSTFEMMGFSFDHSKMPLGELVFRKRLRKLRPPRYKKPKKIYFDDQGNPCSDQEYDQQDILTEDEGPEIQSDCENNIKEVINEEVPKHSDNIANTQEDEELLKDVCIDKSENIDGTELEGDKESSDIVENINKTKRRKKQKRLKHIEDCNAEHIPEELRGEPKLMKYWSKRHSLFHRFDEGVKLDRESWFSVTPESVARHIAHKYRYESVVDAFCGAGGNTIQFALTCDKVIAIDIDPLKVEMARHNAQVYGVEDKIEFVVGDFFELAPTLAAEMVFLSPPWGGPNYSNNVEYDIETMLAPQPASELVRVARGINTNVTLYLPRNSKTDQILAIGKQYGGTVEIEQSFLDRRFVAITAYFY